MPGRLRSGIPAINVGTLRVPVRPRELRDKSLTLMRVNFATGIRVRVPRKSATSICRSTRQVSRRNWTSCAKKPNQRFRGRQRRRHHQASYQHRNRQDREWESGILPHRHRPHRTRHHRRNSRRRNNNSSRRCGHPFRSGREQTTPPRFCRSRKILLKKTGRQGSRSPLRKEVEPEPGWKTFSEVPGARAFRPRSKNNFARRFIPFHFPLCYARPFRNLANWR